MGIIRFLLAIAVVFAHTGHEQYMQMVGGKLAVELFYIFSGFYMALILTEKYVGLKMYKVFITNRMLKLYPIYWVVALLVILFSLYIAFDTNWRFWGVLQSYKLYWSKISVFSFLFLVISNIIVFFQDWIMFMGVNLTSGNFFFTDNFVETSPRLHSFLLVPQAWTIGLELTFYLIVPFFARKNTRWLILIGTASVACKVLLAVTGYNNDPWTYRFFFSELHLFILGMIAYRVYNRIKHKSFSLRKLQAVLCLDILLILFCVFLRTYLCDFTDYIYLIVFACSVPFLFALCKQSKLDSKIGELSYPIYISHGLVILLLNYIFKLQSAYEGWGVAIATIALSFLLNHLILYPIDRYRQKRVKKS